MSNEIQTIDMQKAYPMAELREVANAFVECGFYGFRKPAEALVLMLQARADGIDPMTAAAQYSIIQGRPALKSEAILIRFQAAGGSIKWVKREDEICTLWLSHPKGGELEVTWDKTRATKAKLWNKDNFQKHPAQMLAARCISEGVRALFPACLSGCYTPEEIQFFDEKPQAPQAAPKAKAAKADPVKEAVEAFDEQEKDKKSAKVAEVVDAEVVEHPAEVNEAEESFVRYMEDLHASAPALFVKAWSQYIEKYGDNFRAVEPEMRQTVYNSMKRAISMAASNSVNDYLEA